MFLYPRNTDVSMNLITGDGRPNGAGEDEAHDTTPNADGHNSRNAHTHTRGSLHCGRPPTHSLLI